MAAYDNRGYLHPFWNGNIYLYGVGELPRTVTELAMCRLSAEIRSTKGWWTRIHNSDCREAWRRKADRPFSVRTPSGPSIVQLSSAQIEYVLDELSGYAALHDSVNHCQVSSFDRIWETTMTADPGLRSRLNKAFDLLRSTFKFSDSRRVCVDIVDPHMHPLVYGRTLAKDSDGNLRSVPRPQLTDDTYGLSTNFAWIPTPFSVSSSVLPLSVHALSYISGIDPSLTQLTADIQESLARAIPLFEHVLTDLSRDNPLYHRIPGDCKYTEWDEPEEPEHSDDEEGWLTYQREMRHWALTRPIVYPDISQDGYQGGLEIRHSRTMLRGSTVLVYTHVMDICLQPNGPSYEGTPWHASGMRNEHIAATAIQCLFVDNITLPKVDIRIPVRSPRKFLPGDAGATSRAWGLDSGAPSNQFVGCPAIRPGHTVAFPNIYQYRLTEARLLDESRPGSMRLLTFYLVDPEMSRDSEVLSTSAVPPQQTDWIHRALEDNVDVRVPVEIIEKIMSFVEGLMNDEEVLRYASRMRREREQFWKIHDQQWFSLPFNIWQN